MQLTGHYFEKSSLSCLQMSKLHGFLRYWSKYWTLCGWIGNWVLPHHCCSILRASWRICERVFGNFLQMRIVHIPLYNIHSRFLVEFVYNQASQLFVEKIPLCRQHLATDPSSVSPVSVAVIFLPPSMEQIHHYSVSPSPCHLAGFVMSHEELSEAPSISRKGQV